MYVEKESLVLSVSDSGVATLSLTQGERGNPIDGTFCKDFKGAMNDLSVARGVRVLAIQAEGKNYSVGGDIKSFAARQDDLPALIYEWTGNLHMGLSRLWQLPFPVIVGVQGMAMGGAVAVLAGADVVIAAENAKFGSAFTQLGFSCDSGSSITLSMRMGPIRAKRFVMLGEVLSATMARDTGLVDKVVVDSELADELNQLSSTLANGPTLAYGEIRRLFLQAGAIQLERQLEDEAQTLARIGGTEDAKGAISAFLDRKKAVFVGK